MGFFSRGARQHDRLEKTTSWPVYGADLTTDELSPQAALSVADVFACVRILSESAAMLPLIPYRTLAQGGREKFAGKLADLIARPAPANTTSNLISTTMAHLALFGNAYWGKFRDDQGDIVQIAPIQPQKVAVRLVGGEPLYQYYALEGVEELTIADIVHFKGMSVDGVIGLSPISQARRALSLAQNLETYASNFAANAGRPGGILKVGQWAAASSGEGDDARTAWDAELGTPENSGKLMVVSGSGDIQYTQLSLSLEDAQFVAQRELSTAEVCRIFRVPPWMVGGHVERGLTYSNAEMQAQAFLRFTLQPWLVLIEQAITADPDLSPSTVYCEFLVDAMLRADTATRAQFYTAALNPNTGWMTRAEVRELENLSEEGTTQWNGQSQDNSNNGTPPMTGMPRASTVNGSAG